MKDNKHVSLEPLNNKKSHSIKYWMKKNSIFSKEYLKSLLIATADNIISYFAKPALIDIPISTIMKDNFLVPLLEIGILTIFFAAKDVFKSKNKSAELRIQSNSIFFGVSIGKIAESICKNIFNLGSLICMPIIIFFNSFSSFKYGKILRNRLEKLATEAEKTGAGLNSNISPGGKNNGGPCGVEFRTIETINGITEPCNFLNKTINIFIETDSESDVKNAFNSICLPKYKNRSIQEYFETILQEVSDSIDLNCDLPFVSLHFNNDKTLYSVMPSFYKNTIIGKVFTFLDYFLKGFVNGGFFSIDLVRNWASKKTNERITDTDILNQNLILVKDSLVRF